MDPCVGFWQFDCPYCSRSESAGNSSVFQPIFSLETFICKAALLEFIISENCCYIPDSFKVLGDCGRKERQPLALSSNCLPPLE